MAGSRVYAETLPYEDITKPSTIALLQRHRVSLVLAVRPWQLGELPTVAKTMADAGVELIAWPMLSDEEGRWANAGNATSFAQFCERVIEVAPVRELLLDLEPPFAEARTLAASPSLGVLELAAGARGFAASERILSALVADLAKNGVATSCAVWPLVALDAPGERGWQELLGTPVDALAVCRVSVMVYTSILEGWSRGLVKRDDAGALLSGAADRIVRRWGDRAAISLGCVGVGALESEPTYRDPSELAADVARAKRAGCTDIALFDLGGVLARPPADAWLEALRAPASEASPDTRLVRAARPLARALTTAALPLLGAIARRL